MRYIDLHTHHAALHPNDQTIFSVDIREPLFPNSLWYSVGVHPWYIDSNDREIASQLFEKVRAYSLLSSVVAIGETGLDKMTVKTTSDYQFQQTIFTSHALLAEETKKPLIIHCVRSWNELVRIHQSVQPSMPWIVHGFRGNELLAIRLLNAGFYLSFGQYYHKEALKTAWSNRHIFAETDDNQIDIHTVYHQIATDLNVSTQQLSDEIAACFHRITVNNTYLCRDFLINNE